MAFTYNTVKESSSVNDFTMLDHAEALDDTAVIFHMTAVFHLALHHGCDRNRSGTYMASAYGSNPISSGRYILKQWDKGQQVILDANPDYYGEQPNMQRVTIVFMEEDAAFLAAQAGEVDLAYTSATYSDQTVEGYSLASYGVDNWDSIFRLSRSRRQNPERRSEMILLQMCRYAVLSMLVWTVRK